MRFLLLTLLLLGTLGTLCAQTDYLTLSEAIQRALEYNYQIRLAENRVDVARSNDDWALAGRYPTISLTLGSNNTYVNRNDPTSIVTSTSIYGTGIAPGVAVNWTLFNGYRVRVTKEQLETRVVLSEGQLQLQVENTVQRVIQAYNTALVQREQVELLEILLELDRDRVAYDDVRREFGQGNTFEALQTQDALLADSTNYLIQQTSYENALRNLLLAMGEETPDISGLDLADTINFNDNQYDRAALEADLLAANQTLENLLVNRELARIGTELAETARYPTVTLSAGINYDIGLNSGVQTFNFGGMPDEREVPEVAVKTFSGQVNLSANYLLFDAGARRRRIETARIEELGAQLDYEGNRQNLVQTLANTLNTYENQRALIALSDARLTNAERNLEIAAERRAGGTINSFDYRNIQLNFLNAGQQRLNALLNLKNTETELLRLSGRIVR